MNPLLRWLTSPEWAQIVAALLHSLWQGAIVALALAVLMRRLTNPLARYRCALSTLGVIVIASIGTWAVLNTPQSPAPPAAAIAAIEPAATPSAANQLAPTGADKVVVLGQMTRPEARPNWTAWLALTWMAGAAVMLLRAGIKVAGAEKLRRSCQPLADEPIARLVAEASRAVGLARKIRVAVTDKLTSPAVVGILVPTLILPLSLFTTLTPAQLQFVLLHELAHIRRGDYLANLFQLFAEALLFFNPAIWWISHQIRREREACCDALAIELSGAPADYARTLVRVAENILQPTPDTALAFGDDGREPSSLADRVQRLLVPGYRPSLRLTWRAMLTALFVGSALLFLSAVGTRVTVAAILSPRERIERIEKKMSEYGESLRGDSSSDDTNAPKVELSGRVTTADGSPLSPKLKWVNIYYSRKNSSGTANSARLQTNGIFRTEIRSGRRVVAVLNDPDFAPVVAGPVVLEGTNAITNLDLVLERGFHAPIIVTDAETGVPVPGALGKAQFWAPNMGFGLGKGRELQTDAMGVTTMSNCSASVELTLTVNAPGYEIADHRAPRLNANEPIRIPLKRGQPLSGMVLDKHSATPLTGATVRLIYEKGQKERHYQWTDAERVLATTDATGRFTVTQLRRGTKYWLGISAPGHESQLLGPVMAGASDLTVRLGPELIVRGRVLGDLDGLQIINKDYCLSRNYSEVFDDHSYGDHEWLPLRVENGFATFQFTNPIPGILRLSGRSGFSEEREITASVADWVIDLNQARKSLPEAPPQREVIFRFTHPSGVLPRGTVSVSIPDSLDPKHRTAHTEAHEITNGQVRVNIAVSGQTRVESKRTVGYWFKATDYFEVTNGNSPLVVTIPCLAAGAIYAKARNADGTPAGGLFFGIEEIKRAPGRSENHSLGSSSDGFSDDGPRKWVSGPLPLGGTYQVHGWRGNSFCVSRPIKLTEAKPDAEVELQFAPGKTISGVLLDAGGQPVRDADLKLLFKLENGHSFGLKPVVTDERGEFHIEDASPELGEYSAEINAPGQMAEHVKLAASSRPQLIRLQRGRSLGGQVVEAGTGDVIPNVEVRAADMSTYKPPMLKTRTDAAGRFEFTTLGDVEYQFFVEDGQQTSNQKFRADGRTNLTLKVTLYEWSKAKPKPANTNSPNQARTYRDKVPFLDDLLSGRLDTNQFRLISIATNDVADREARYASEQAQLNQQWFWNRAGETNPKTAALRTNVEPLVTRTFEVDVNGFYAAVRKAAGQPATVNITNLGPAFRTFFAQAGVNLDPQLGKSFFFSDSRGDMWVRATKDELDIIERLLKPLAGIPLSRGNYQISPEVLAKAQRSLPPEISSVFATNPAAGFRALLESFDPTDPRPKRVHYNPDTGELQARATEADLQKFASALKVVPLPRKQFQLKSSAAPDAPPELTTRTFAVGPMELAKALGRTGPLMITNTAEMVSECLVKAGLDLQPPKSVFFKDPLSLLLVRATPAELDALEKFLARTNQETASAPPTAKVSDSKSSVSAIPSSTNLHTRTFGVDMNALTQAVIQRLGTNMFSPGKPNQVIWLSALRQLFASMGVDLELPESLYLNDRKGELFVRATLADLDAIETFLQVLNHQAPQVNIKVRWIEIPTDTDLIALLPRPTNAIALPVFRPQKLFGILTEAQTEEFLQRLHQNKGVSLISEGQVTTLSARQAQLQVAEVKTIMTGIRSAALTPPGVVATNTPAAAALNAEVVPLGPVLDVTPCASSDQTQISLHVEASTKEFLGYDQKAPTVLVYINGKKGKTTLPLPKFLVRQMTNDCVLRDGQTLVLGHLPTTEIATQPDGTIQRTDMTATKTNNLCVLVTATLIDPAGNRLNSPK